MDAATVGALGPAPADAMVRPHDRIDWIDIARGIGILAVVIWHVTDGLIRAGVPAPPQTDSLVVAWDLYVFRAMPVFFLLSGAMLGTGGVRPTGEIVGQRARILLWPYLVWSTISLVGGSLAGGATNHQLGLLDLPRILYDPVLQFWFLPALFIVTVAWLVPRRAGVPGQLLVTIAAIVAVGVAAAGPAFGWYFGRQVAQFAVYFALGAYLGRPFVERIAGAPRGLMALVGGVSAAVVFMAVIGGPIDPWFPIVIATGALGTVMIVAAARALTGTRVGSLAAFLGRASLEIYLVHVIAAVALRAFLVRFAHVDLFVIDLVVGIAVGIAAGLVLARVSRVRGFGWLVRFPMRRPTRADPEATVPAGEVEPASLAGRS